MRLSQTFEYLRGSALAIFFFENDLTDIFNNPGIENRSYLGFIDSIFSDKNQILRVYLLNLLQVEKDHWFK